MAASANHCVPALGPMALAALAWEAVVPRAGDHKPEAVRHRTAITGPVPDRGLDVSLILRALFSSRK